MTVSNILIDSSAWLDYFLIGSKECAKYIDSRENTLFTSALSLHEVKKKLLRKQISASEVKEILSIIKSKSIIIPADEKICEESAQDCIAHNLTTVDAVIYRTAVENNALLITLDNDFKGLKNTKVL